MGHQRRMSRDSNGVLYAELDILEDGVDQEKSLKEVQVDKVYGIP